MFATFDLSLSFQRSVFSGDLHSISGEGLLRRRLLPAFAQRWNADNVLNRKGNSPCEQ
jgi:hypothetical protein